MLGNNTYRLDCQVCTNFGVVSNPFYLCIKWSKTPNFIIDCQLLLHRQIKTGPKTTNLIDN